MAAPLVAGSKEKGLKDRLMAAEQGSASGHTTAATLSEYQAIGLTPQPRRCAWIDVVTVDSAIALAVFGQAGVLTRWGWSFLANYQEQCHGSVCRAEGDWVPNTWVAPFACLPANMVGCLIMGLLSDGKTISAQLRRNLVDGDEDGRAEVERVAALPLAMAPGLSSASGCAAVLLGLRTGYCGCLTSFSAVEHLTLTVTLTPTPTLTLTPTLVTFEVLLRVEHGAHRRSTHVRAVGLDDRGLRLRPHPVRVVLQGGPAARALHRYDARRPHAQCVCSACAVRVQCMWRACTVHVLCVHSARAVRAQCMCSACTVHTCFSITMAPGCRVQFPQRVAAWCGRNAAVVRSIFLSVLVAEFSLLMVQVFTCGQPTYSTYLPGSQQYVPGSCADDTPSPAPLFDLFFAPFGVWLRWRLGLLNGRFKTFPIGTFTANIIACAIDCFIAGAEYRYTFNPWSLMIMTAVCFNSP